VRWIKEVPQRKSKGDKSDFITNARLSSKKRTWSNSEPQKKMGKKEDPKFPPPRPTDWSRGNKGKQKARYTE